MSYVYGTNQAIWGPSGATGGASNQFSSPKEQAQFQDWSPSGSDYDTWRQYNQQGKTVEQFVDRLARGDPTAARNQATMAGALGNFGGRLNQYLDTPGPQMATGNRFEAGLGANEQRLNALLNDPNSVQQTAAYKFRVGQGQEALNRNLAAKGMLGSGNRLMELTKYGQDMGSQEYEAQAKRLSDLVGGYSQSWLGDKNANTQAFGAQSTDWARRGGLLGDLYSSAATASNAATQGATDTRTKWGSIWAGINK